MDDPFRYHVFITPLAEEDMQEIYTYGRLQFGPDQADQYLAKLLDAFDLIAESPLIFQLAEEIESDLRRCVCGSHCIYFCIAGTDIEILRILDRQEIKSKTFQAER